MAELLGALSLGIDLGFGQPMEHVLRQCRIALRLGELAGLDEEERAALYYAALLVNVGCHSDAYEQAHWFGDDLAMKATKYDYEPFSAADIMAMLRLLGSGSTPLHRIRVAFDFALAGRKEIDGMIAGHARLARALGEELGLDDQVLAALGASYERWDGKGFPGELSGTDIPMCSRIVQLADFAEVAHRTDGIEGAQALARRRSASQFDPDLVAMLCEDAEKVFHDLDELGSWEPVIAAEPSLAVLLSPVELDAALEAVATFVDLKSPYRLGHSVAVADLAAEAGRRVGLPAEDRRSLRRAGLVIGFGRLGVSNSIWDQAGPLSAGQWERVRLHPQITERMLNQSPALAPLGRLAGQHCERLDGSGYPRGAHGAAVSVAGKVLAAADVYQALREPRPYREAWPASDAATQLRREVEAGRLDDRAAEAVLVAAGHRVTRRREGPAGLTAREVEVLRLLVRGLSNKQVAARLVISPKTVGNHVEHIYTKIGATNRAGASLFAMQAGLLPEEGFDGA